MRKILCMLSILCIGNLIPSIIHAQIIRDTSYEVIDDGTLYRFIKVTQNGNLTEMDIKEMAKNCPPRSELSMDELLSLTVKKTVNVIKKTKRTVTSKGFFKIRYVETTFQYSLDNISVKNEIINPAKSGVMPNWTMIIIVGSSAIILIIGLIVAEIILRHKRRKNIKKQNAESFGEPE